MKDRLQRSSWAFSVSALLVVPLSLMGPTGAYKWWMQVLLMMAVYGVMGALIALCTRRPRADRALRLGAIVLGICVLVQVLSRVGVFNPQNELHAAGDWVVFFLHPVAGVALGAWLMQCFARRPQEAV